MPDETEHPAIDVQDPLPESNWFWRRVFTFAAVSATFGFMFYAMYLMGRVAEKAPRTSIPALLEIVNDLIWMQGLLFTFYLIAPSAEQVVKMIQTAGLLRRGVQFASRSVQEDGRTEIAQTAGQPPQPRVPSIPPTQGGSGRRPYHDDDDVAPRSRGR